MERIYVELRPEIEVESFQQLMTTLTPEEIESQDLREHFGHTPERARAELASIGITEDQYDSILAGDFQTIRALMPDLIAANIVIALSTAPSFEGRRLQGVIAWYARAIFGMEPLLSVQFVDTDETNQQ